MNNQNQERNRRSRSTHPSSSSYQFYLVGPPANSNTTALAEKLINLRNVKEVFVTDGDYGFIVKAKLSNCKKQDNAYRYLSRLGGNLGRATSHYQYRK